MHLLSLDREDTTDDLQPTIQYVCLKLASLLLLTVSRMTELFMTLTEDPADI